MDWSQLVLDIREQYPLLPLEETQEIANQCGFKHPTDPKTRQPIVMTTDFLITLKDKKDKTREIDHARAIKLSTDLLSPRTLEKLEIERLYWGRRKIDWGIVTEEEIPGELVNNLIWVHSLYRKEALAPLSQEDITRIERALRPQVIQGKPPLTRITNSCDDMLGLNPGRSLSVVRYLIANRYWLVNMNQKIQPSKALQLVAVQAIETYQELGKIG